MGVLARAEEDAHAIILVATMRLKLDFLNALQKCIVKGAHCEVCWVVYCSFRGHLI